MLWASMLRFWLLEQTTATLSGEEGMAGGGRGRRAKASSSSLGDGERRTPLLRLSQNGGCRDRKRRAL